MIIFVLLCTVGASTETHCAECNPGHFGGPVAKPVEWFFVHWWDSLSVAFFQLCGEVMVAWHRAVNFVELNFNSVLTVLLIVMFIIMYVGVNKAFQVKLVKGIEHPTSISLSWFPYLVWSTFCVMVAHMGLFWLSFVCYGFIVMQMLGVLCRFLRWQPVDAVVLQVPSVKITCVGGDVDKWQVEFPPGVQPGQVFPVVLPELMKAIVQVSRLPKVKKEVETLETELAGSPTSRLDPTTVSNLVKVSSVDNGVDVNKGSGFRLKFLKHDALVTATHNLKTGVLRLTTAKASCLLTKPKVLFMSAAGSVYGDITIIEVPLSTWSRLGVSAYSKVQKPAAAQFVTTIGFDKDGVGSATGSGEWANGILSYRASTREGWSGGPVTGTAGVLGVHLRGREDSNQGVSLFEVIRAIGGKLETDALDVTEKAMSLEVERELAYHQGKDWKFRVAYRGGGRIMTRAEAKGGSVKYIHQDWDVRALVRQATATADDSVLQRILAKRALSRTFLYWFTTGEELTAPADDASVMELQKFLSSVQDYTDVVDQNQFSQVLSGLKYYARKYSLEYEEVMRALTEGQMATHRDFKQVEAQEFRVPNRKFDSNDLTAVVRDRVEPASMGLETSELKAKSPLKRRGPVAKTQISVKDSCSSRAQAAEDPKVSVASPPNSLEKKESLSVALTSLDATQTCASTSGNVGAELESLRKTAAELKSLFQQLSGKHESLSSTPLPKQVGQVVSTGQSADPKRNVTRSDSKQVAGVMGKSPPPKPSVKSLSGPAASTPNPKGPSGLGRKANQRAKQRERERLLQEQVKSLNTQLQARPI